MACGDVLSLDDLQTAKKHQIFEAEVITGKVGGVSTGADIDYATNQVTGQTQKTLPAILRDTGFRPASFTFATGGTLAVGDSDVVVLWPISAGGDGQYYLWKGAYPKTIPAASSPASTGGVSDSGWLPWGDVTLREDLSKAVIYVRMQGGIFDGVSDNTSAIMQAHTAANLLNATVSYAGIKDFAIDANAQIPINTNVDFCGARCHILNGLHATPSFNTLDVTFLVADPSSPVITASGVFTGSLSRGSRTPTKGLFDGQGVAILEAPYLIPDRAGTGTVNYKQTFNVIRGGQCTLPLSVDLSGFESQLIVKYRKTSPYIRVNAPTLVEGGYNNLSLIKVSRCNVDIIGFALQHENSANFNNINSLIDLDTVSRVNIIGISASGQPVTSSTGSYVFRANFIADCVVSGMKSSWLGWASTGTNHVNGLHFYDCDLSRADAHEGGHNIFVDNCVLLSRGVTYGWGGGIISVTNCTAIDCFEGVVFSREDYGGNFFGGIVVDNINLQYSTSAQLTLVDISAGASITTYLPETIKITNVHWSGKASSSSSNRLLINVKKRAGVSGSVVAPNTTVLDGVTSDHNFHMSGTLDYDNFIARPSIFRYNIVIRNIIANVIPAKGSGFIIPTGAGSSIDVYIDISDSDFILLECAGVSIVRQVFINNSGVCGVDVNQTAASTAQVELNDCEFRFPASGYVGLVPIGGPGFGSEKFTRISGGTISYAGFDFSKIEAASGVLMLNGTGTGPSIPAGWIPDDLFNGKKSATRFRSTT